MGYKIHYKLIQELSTFRGDLHYKGCLHQTSTSDRQRSRKLCEVDSLECSPRSRQTLDDDPCIDKYPADSYTTLKMVGQCQS